MGVLCCVVTVVYEYGTRRYKGYVIHIGTSTNKTLKYHVSINAASPEVVALIALH